MSIATSELLSSRDIGQIDGVLRHFEQFDKERKNPESGTKL